MLSEEPGKPVRRRERKRGGSLILGEKIFRNMKGRECRGYNNLGPSGRSS